MSADRPRPTRRAMLAGFAASPVVATGVGVFPSKARAQAEIATWENPNPGTGAAPVLPNMYGMAE